MPGLGDFTSGMMQGLTFGNSLQDRNAQNVRADEELDMRRQQFKASMERNELEIEGIKDAKELREYSNSLWNGAEALEFGDMSKASQDDVNRVFGSFITQGSDDKTNKRFDKFVPTEDGKGVYVDLVVEHDGKKEIKPVTQNRSSDPNDPVVAIPLEELYMEVMAKTAAMKRIAYKLKATGDDSLLKYVVERENKILDYFKDKEAKQTEHNNRMAEKQFDLDNPSGKHIEGYDGTQYWVHGDKARPVNIASKGLTVADNSIFQGKLGPLTRGINQAQEVLISSNGLTRPQWSNDAEITAARKAISGMTREDIIRKTQDATNTGRANPEFDPYMKSLVAKALTRKVGEDPEFESLYTQFYGSDNSQTSTSGKTSKPPQEMSNEELLKYIGGGD